MTADSTAASNEAQTLRTDRAAAGQARDSLSAAQREYRIAARLLSGSAPDDPAAAFHLLKSWHKLAAALLHLHKEPVPDDLMRLDCERLNSLLDRFLNSSNLAAARPPQSALCELAKEYADSAAGRPAAPEMHGAICSEAENAACALRRFELLLEEREGGQGSRVKRLLRRHRYCAALAAALLAAAAYIPFSPFWSDVYVIRATQTRGTMRLIPGSLRPAQKAGGEVYRAGFLVRANSEIVLGVAPKYRTFSGKCGLDSTAGESASVKCVIRSNHKRLFAGPVIRFGDPPVSFSVPLAGRRRLELHVTGAGDGTVHDTAQWFDLRFK